MTLDASPVQPDPVRAVAYIRVSQARDGMISPDLQLRAISDYCQRRGYQITQTLQDLDLSGRIWRHRQMERPITMIEQDEADAIVVWRWSRISRNRLDWAVAVDRVETAGGELESATESFDTSTSTGRLARGVLAELAAFESERMGDVWREILERRIAHGLPSTGQEMFGYRKRADGRYVPDGRTGPILAEMYRRYNRGTSFAELARWLNSHRIATVKSNGANRTWTLRSVVALMDRGFAAGLVTYHGELVPGAHEPVIETAVWDTYRASRATAKYTPRRSFDDFLVLGLAWCACGKPMTATHTATRPGPRYQCRDHPSGRPGASMVRVRLDGMVRSWLTALVDDPDIRRRAEICARNWANFQAWRAADVRDQLQAAPDVERRAALLHELEQIRGIAAAPPTPTTQAAALLEDWDLLDGEGRRDRMSALIHRIRVENVRPTPLLEFATTWGSFMTWNGTQADRDLPTPPPPAAAPPAEEGACETPTDPLQLLTPAEAARIAGVKVHTVRSWDVAGHLPHTQWSPGGVRRYAIEDLRRLQSRYKTDGVWVAFK